jgi:hypothetical protein
MAPPHHKPRGIGRLIERGLLWGWVLALITAGFYLTLYLLRQIDLLERTFPAYELELFLFLVNGLTTIGCALLEGMAQHGCQTILWIVLVIPSAFTAHVLFWMGITLPIYAGIVGLRRVISQYNC